MDFLERPKLDKTTVQIYQECIAGYVGNPRIEGSVEAAKKKKTMLEKFCKAVEASAELYDSSVPDYAFQEPPIPPDVASEECRKRLQKVYEEKFAPINAPGRSYYELIRRTKECGKCPICGGSCGITHLDHYLPKSSYPTLCVHPNNLIPICDSCNTIKGAKENQEEMGLPIHLYFDRLPQKKHLSGKKLYTEPYLFADLDDDFRPKFRIKCPAEWDPKWEKRLVALMKMYDLDSRYRACVFAEYAKILSAWEIQVDLSVMRRAEKENKKPEELYAALTERELKRLRIRALEAVINGNLTSCGDLNSWKYALYRALEYGEQELAAWLDESEEHVRTVEKQCEAELKHKQKKLPKYWGMKKLQGKRQKMRASLRPGRKIQKITINL